MIGDLNVPHLTLLQKAHKKMGRPKGSKNSSKKPTSVAPAVDEATTDEVQPIYKKAQERSSGLAVPVNEFAEAMAKVLDAAKPPTKKTIFTRKQNTPWTPKDGSPRLKLKRKIYQHGILLDQKFLSNPEIDAMNKLRPGSYCGGFIRVVRRRDKGLDIDYPIKSPAQRMRLPSTYGLRNITEVVQQCILEAAQPKRPEFDEFGDATV